MGRQHDVALAGFDDVQFSETLEAITVVAQDTVTIGRTASERHFARINGDRSPARVYTIDSHLITRGSGELPLVPTGNGMTRTPSIHELFQPTRPGSPPAF